MLDKPRNVLRRFRPLKIKALHFVATGCFQMHQLLLAFHAFCNDLHSEIVCQRNGRGHDHRVVHIVVNISDKRAIDLDHVNRQRLKAAESCEASWITRFFSSFSSSIRASFCCSDSASV